MSNQINDGGPAFPTGPNFGTMKPHPDGTLIVTHYGMQSGVTIRDYFAAAALQGLIASRGSMSTRFLAEDDASYVFEIADAMIRAREAKP